MRVVACDSQQSRSAGMATRAPLAGPARAVFRALKAGSPPAKAEPAAAAASLQPPGGRTHRPAVAAHSLQEPGAGRAWVEAASNSDSPERARAVADFEADWRRHQPQDWSALSQEARLYFAHALCAASFELPTDNADTKHLPLRSPLQERRLAQLQAALAIEAERGYPNFLGTKLRCSEFIADALVELAHQPPPWLPANAAVGNLAWSFMRYDSTPAELRPGVVSKAQATLQYLRAALRQQHSPGSPPPPGVSHSHVVLSTGGQRTAAWLAAREGLLTASQFGAVLGLHGPARQLEAWEQRVKLRAPFVGNAATAWGVDSEPLGVAAYERLTGAVLEHPDLGCIRDAPGEAPWLGASPDGLIVGQPGVLEVKCPVRRATPGSGPETAQPYERLPVYYVPQLLGVLRVFDRQFGDLFCYTQQHGCTSWQIARHADTWTDMEDVLRSFWKEHVLPARAALQAGVDAAEVRAQFQPVFDQETAGWAQAECDRISREAEATQYASPPLAELRRAAGMDGGVAR